MEPCVICKEPITDQPAYAKTHAGACRKARRRQKERERYKTRVKTLRAPKVCEAPDCDNVFTPKSNNRKYCQQSCASRVHNMRQREKTSHGVPDTTIRYDRKPDLAVFLAKRPGDFPQARAYVAEHPELIAA